MSALPRGVCSVCGVSVALRTKGIVREHRTKVRGGKAGPKICAGSGKPTVTS